MLYKLLFLTISVSKTKFLSLFSDKVRSLIIGDRRSPHFRNLQKCEVSAFSEVKTLVKRCQNQVRAVTHSMMADDFLLIDGGADERLQSGRPLNLLFTYVTLNY